MDAACFLWAALFVQLLGHDSFRVRDAASAALASCPDGWTLLVIQLAARSPDVEVRRRGQQAARVYLFVLPSNYPVLPWIDMMPGAQAENKEIVDCFLNEARQQVAPWGGEPWLEYRVATGLYCAHRLWWGDSRENVRRLLDVMVENEIAYRKARSMPLLSAAAP